MKSPSTAPLTVPLNPDEPRSEYLLRVAAAFLSAYAPENPVIYDDECDDMVLGDGETLTRDCLALAEELQAAREKQQAATHLVGTLIEAGNNKAGTPRLIIETTVESLKNCGRLPLYRRAEITLTPRG